MPKHNPPLPSPRRKPRTRWLVTCTLSRSLTEHGIGSAKTKHPKITKQTHFVYAPQQHRVLDTPVLGNFSCNLHRPFPVHINTSTKTQPQPETKGDRDEPGPVRIDCDVPLYRGHRHLTRPVAVASSRAYKQPFPVPRTSDACPWFPRIGDAVRRT